MSVTAVSQSTAQPTSTASDWEVMRNNLCNPGHWTWLVPTVGAIALGILFAPNFSLGLAAGAVMAGVSAAVAMTLGALGIMKEDENSKYEKDMHDNPLLGTLAAPVLEEGFFRGMLQPLATRAILWLAPAAAGAFLGTGLSIALTVSIVATAALFGTVHYFNEHKNAHIQAIICCFSGVAFGLLAAQFGLGASIAAHMTNNSLLITASELFYREPPPASTTALSHTGG